MITKSEILDILAEMDTHVVTHESKKVYSMLEKLLLKKIAEEEGTNKSTYQVIVEFDAYNISRSMMDELADHMRIQVESLSDGTIGKGIHWSASVSEWKKL